MKQCPHCGSENSDGLRRCAFCGLEMSSFTIIPKNTRTKRPNAKVTSVVSESEPKNKNTVRSSAKKSGRSNNGLKILGWLLCFPLMLTLIALKKKTLRWYVLAAVGWIVYVIWIVFTPRTESTPVSPTPSDLGLMETATMNFQLSFTPTPPPLMRITGKIRICP